MPTIGQLPSLDAGDAADEIPISHGGVTQSISVGSLLSGVQPAIQAPTGTLLGRESLGPGGPETINVGVGLDLQASILTATGADHANFPSQLVLVPTDQAVLSSSGSPMLVELSLLRGLFAAGSNIAIDSAGTISAMVDTVSGGTNTATYNIAALPVATAISATDLVGISRNGTADAITYQNFLNGLTIDEAQQATATSDSDTTWVAQGGETMVCQTFSAIWSWFASKLPTYKCPVIEITTDTTLDETVHNARILVCSQPVTLTPIFSNMGSGFGCSVINLSNANVTLGAGIVSSSGEPILPVGLSCVMQGVTYSGGSVIYASISGGLTQSNQTAPGGVSGLAVTNVSSTQVSLSWLAPSSGGAVTDYTLQYQVSGGTSWIIASPAVIGTSHSVSNLQPSTTYVFAVCATNPAGSGPLSSPVTGATIASGVIPGQITRLSASAPTDTSLTLAWSPPSVGTIPISYAIQYRVTGTTTWITYASGILLTSTSVTGLSASTNYDFEVSASNALGASPQSAVVSQSTIANGAAVTAVTWNVAPTGSYTHGSGSIGVNAHITPASAPVQFGFSASLTVPPVTWTAAILVNTDLWAAYVNTPTTAGTWYAWVEGADGSFPTVCPASFTVI